MWDYSVQPFRSNSTTWPIGSINFTQPLSILPRVTDPQTAVISGLDPNKSDCPT
jgi:hypothetical protein